MKHSTKSESAPAPAGGHTPGPWMVMLAYDDPKRAPFPYEVFNIIGNTDDDERKHSVVATTIHNREDARLIASAPALLAERDRMRAALAALLRADELPPSVEAAKVQVEAMQQARAAIEEGGR